MTTKGEYIENHPKSELARRLNLNDWPSDTKIEIIGGLIAPYNKNSNLYKALQITTKKEWIIGGHRRYGTEGWWIAVA